jgi:hypothetical protein
LVFWFVVLRSSCFLLSHLHLTLRKYPLVFLLRYFWLITTSIIVVVDAFRKSLTSIANKPLGKGNSNLEWGLELVHFKTKMLASNCLWLASKHKSLWMIQVDWGVKACLLV